MQHQQILPVLYDLSVTIGGEVRLKPLLTRTLQRLLYHTSFSAGFVCLDMTACEGEHATKQVRMDAAVGDFDLISHLGKPFNVPCELVYGCASHETLQAELLSDFGTTRSRYQSFFRLPLANNSVIVLLAIAPPETHFDLAKVLQPVLAQLEKAIVLCRMHDAQQSAAKATQDKLQQSLKQIESQFQTLIEISPMGVGLSSDGVIIDVNEAFLRLFGFTHVGELCGKPLIACIAPPQHKMLLERIKLRAQGLAREDTYESVGLRRDGTQFPIMVSSKRVETDQGARTFSYFIDLTEQKRSEQELRAVNTMMNLVLETAPLRIFWKDQDSRYLGCNHAFARDAGLSEPGQLVGKLDSEMGWHAQADLYRADDLLVMTCKTPRLNFEEPQTTPDGQQIWLRTSKVPLFGPDGEEMGVLGVYDDITEYKLAQAQVHQLAHYDVLTGLPNRQLLLNSLHKALAVSARNRRFGAVLFLDLDDFKTLNDSKGPAVGDRLLVAVAKRLTACVREGGIVARPGGDEFIVMLDGLSEIPTEAASQAELVAERIRTSLAEVVVVDEGTVQTTPSIGIVMFLGHQESADSLLKHADAAMYQAKDAGRNTIRFFDPAMQAELEARLALVSDLGQAVRKGELQLYFQKQVNVQGLATGAEVLLRWLHPMRGLVSPAQFIPLAEETGIIIPVGLWVIQAALRQLRRWQGVPGLGDLTLAVNVSAKQFHQPDFVDQVRRELLDSGAKPSHVKLELTESVVLENVEETIAKMRELKLLGISFSMDDFGTGYSSLQYLKRLPLDQLKIDQSFVRDITTDPNDAAIVQTIIAMTDALGLNVIAEGVETLAQKQFLAQRGCHAFQGFFFGRPVPLVAFEADINHQSQP
jgi:diguanylate cyclase (GGDEF)-like protein/PAS domain S-box-containing protein